MQNTQTYNFIQKSFLLCIIPQLNSDGKFHQKKSSARRLVPVVFLSNSPKIKEASEGQQCFLELRPSASNVPLP